MSAVSPDTRQATVIGAGLVGLSCALYLQRAGFHVRLIDRDAPGKGASYGNAGVIAVSSVEPVATVGVLRKVPRMLLDDLAPLSIRWPYMPRLTPWLLRFLAASRPSRVEEISIALREICQPALDAYLPLMDMAGATSLVRRGGWLTVYESDEAFAAAGESLALKRRRGVNFEVLPAEEVRQMEPRLAPTIRHAVHFSDYSWVTSPLALSQSLAEAFQRNGGELRHATVTGFDIGTGGPERINSDAGAIEVGPDEVVVVAAGAHSKQLAAQLGAKVPLDTERGYHVMLPDPGLDLRMPVCHGESGFVSTTMDDGLRLAGTVELGGLDAAPNWRRADVILQHAKRLLPDLNDAGAERWMGFRPSMPDSLPVIGASPRFANAFLAFGHGHLGLTLAAVTGRMIAEMATGQPTSIDAGPYKPDRF